MQDQRLTERSKGRVISVLSWKIRKFNEHLLGRFSSMLVNQVYLLYFQFNDIGNLFKISEKKIDMYISL